MFRRHQCAEQIPVDRPKIRRKCESTVNATSYTEQRRWVKDKLNITPDTARLPASIAPRALQHRVVVIGIPALHGTTDQLAELAKGRQHSTQQSTRLFKRAHVRYLRSPLRTSTLHNNSPLGALPGLQCVHGSPRADKHISAHDGRLSRLQKTRTNRQGLRLWYRRMRQMTNFTVGHVMTRTGCCPSASGLQNLTQSSPTMAARNEHQRSFHAATPPVSTASADAPNEAIQNLA